MVNSSLLNLPARFSFAFSTASQHNCVATAVLSWVANLTYPRLNALFFFSASSERLTYQNSRHCCSFSGWCRALKGLTCSWRGFFRPYTWKLLLLLKLSDIMKVIEKLKLETIKFTGCKSFPIYIKQIVSNCVIKIDGDEEVNFHLKMYRRVWSLHLLLSLSLRRHLVFFCTTSEGTFRFDSDNLVKSALWNHNRVRAVLYHHE